MTRIRFGHRDLDWPGEQIGELRDANDCLGDRDALHARMAEDGYLLIRGLIDPDKIRSARQAIMQYMAEQDALVPGQPVLEGVMPQGGKSVALMGRRDITHAPAVRAALESEELFDFFQTYFDQRPRTFDYKWLRAVGNEQYTGAHYDVVYMGRGSGNLHTAWVPLGDVNTTLGALAVLKGSHNLASFEKIRQTYGRMDVDRDRVQGWFSSDPMELVEKFGGQWQVTNYRAGDVMIFGMYTMHASTTNLTDRFRLSCDIRFQPADDAVDERWVGEHPIGHYGWTAEPEKNVSMETAKAQWGL